MSDFKAKVTKFDFGWGSAPDPAGGAYSAPPEPLAGFRGPTSKGNGEEQGMEWKRKGKGREGRKRGWAGMDDPPYFELATGL